MQRYTHKIADLAHRRHLLLSRTVADLRWRLDQLDQVISTLSRYQQLQGRPVSAPEEIDSAGRKHLDRR
jgi:hypothetical protein